MAKTTIAVLPPVARFSLRLPQSAIPKSVAGFRVDQALLRAVETEAGLSARLGPDEWLLLGARTEAGAIAAGIAAAMAGRFHALVDIGDRQVAFAVAGPQAATLLNAGCPIDLGDAAFPIGVATRTLLGKAEIILIRLGAQDYRVECGRSFAGYVSNFLGIALRDAG